MVEHHKGSIERILWYDSRERQKFSTDQEKLRQSLHDEAAKKIAEYEQEYKELEPRAKDRFKSVVKPWWQEFKESGLFDDLVKWLIKNQQISSLSLSDEIPYPWPTSILEQQSNPNPFNDAAGEILKEIRRKNPLEVIRLEKKYMPENEIWQARFGLRTDKSSEEFFISRWPYNTEDSPPNWFSKGGIELKPGGENRWFSKIHPKVWLGFADQIENGKIWEVLHDSLTWFRKK